MGNMSRRGILAGTVAAMAGTAFPRTASASAEEAASAPVVVLPDDPRYPDLVVGNNARWVGRPDSVHVVNNADQVVRAVQEAVAGNKRISVRGGGHCYADFVFNPDVQVVIDTSNLNAVFYDAEHRAFSVGAGAILLEVYEALFKNWGVTIPGGMCYSVGMGGHISGGGYGLLSRRHGLTIDHLYAVEVVVVNANGTARTVVATREPDDPNRDLWWAHTGGGGGNFGIVTRFLFRTPGATGSDPAQQLMRPPKEVLVSALSLPWSELTQDRYSAMVRAFGSWHAKNTSADASSAGLCSFLMMNHRSNESIGMLTQIDASVPNAEKEIEGFLREVISATGTEARPMTRSAGEQGPLPDFFTPRRLPWLTSMKLLGTSNPTLTNPSLRGAHKSAYLRKEFADAQIAAMYRQLTRTDHQNPASMVVLLSYGGKINNVRSGDTASAQRDSIFKGLFQSFWEGESGDADNIGWTRDVFREVFSASGGYPVPNSVTDGCYINYPDVDITDSKQNTSGVPWFTLYYKDNYPRLQRIKAAYDPRNIFRHSQSIALP
jgi:hypothetical protein